MRLKTTARFDGRLSKRLAKNSGLKKRVSKQLKMLVVNQNHPSLRLHKLEGKRASEFAIWIEGDVRITFQKIGDVLLLTDIITHDEY